MLIKLRHLKDLRAFLKLPDIKWCFISTRNTSANVINFLKASLTVQLIVFSGTKTVELSHKKKDIRQFRENTTAKQKTEKSSSPWHNVECWGSF